jgi:hypothetical protein
MPDRGGIAKEIATQKTMAQDTVRRKYLKELAGCTKADTVVYFSSYHLKRSINIPAALLICRK